REYMNSVQTTLDRAAIVTVFLLLGVLLAVYRSLWLALVPLATIGIGLIISRGVLAWMTLAGWEISPLVELFLIVILFGSGTDFCLFLSWRFGEHWISSNPGGAMRMTMRVTIGPLLTSAGTVIVGHCLMGTTKFKLFSSTGPSVAIGLALTLTACLSLTPALLVLLARYRPRSFAGLTRPSSGFWDVLGHRVLSRPILTWVVTVSLMSPLVVLGLRSGFTQDLPAELPKATQSVRNLRGLITTKFGPGAVAPLTVVLEADMRFSTTARDLVPASILRRPRTFHPTAMSGKVGALRWAIQPGTVLILEPSGLNEETVTVVSTTASSFTARTTLDHDGTVAPFFILGFNGYDLRGSEGLALIDDVSRLIGHQRRLTEVRSATQPLGSPEPFERARLASRLEEVNVGFTKIAEGAEQLGHGLTVGAAKLRTVIQVEEMTGISLTGGSTPPSDDPNREGVLSGLKQATTGLFGGLVGSTSKPPAAPPKPTPKDADNDKVKDPREAMIQELTRAAEGAGQIVEGARRAHLEVTALLADPVGRRALDRLLITPTTIQENPELRRSFETYISPDGRFARFDLTQSYRIFSPEALDQVGKIRQRLSEYLGEMGEEDGLRASVQLTGPNAETFDIRTMTRRDQVQTWIVVPIGVFLILVIALRDVWACINLVATMLLTYAFALGTTHLVFVTLLGAEGIDWKVPYFLFVLLVAVGVDYNVFLMTRLQEEARALGLRAGIIRAVAQTGGLISSAAAITACSFASFLFSPLGSIRQLGFALVVGIVTDAVLVRPLLVPIGQWLMYRRHERRRESTLNTPAPPIGQLARVAD
ncbi:MAG: MMPL family transporter, partial [Isosphaeraceae bacterium]